MMISLKCYEIVLNHFKSRNKMIVYEVKFQNKLRIDWQMILYV